MKQKFRNLVYTTGLVAEGLVYKFTELDVVPKIGILSVAAAMGTVGLLATRPGRIENRTKKMMDNEVYFFGVEDAQTDSFYEIKDSYGTEYVVPKSKIEDALIREYSDQVRDISYFNELAASHEHEYDSSYGRYFGTVNNVYLIYDENRNITVLNKNEIDENNMFAYVNVPVTFDLNLTENQPVKNVSVRTLMPKSEKTEDNYVKPIKGYVVKANNKEYYIEKYQLLKDYNSQILDNTRCEMVEGQEGKWDTLDYRAFGPKTLKINKNY